MYCGEGTRAFCMKLKGDLMRYRAEILEGEERTASIQKAVELYEDALERERSFLDNYPTDPLYLATALNYAILKYTVLGNPKGAIKFVKRIIKTAQNSSSSHDPNSEPLSENSLKLIQILNDNVACWEEGTSGLLTSAFF